MEVKKRKSRDENKKKGDKSSKKFKSKGSRRGVERSTRKNGPRMPNAFRKELERLKPKNDDWMDSEGEEEGDDEFKSENVNDLYEYEEGIAEEESKKNRRFDHVENYEYELPEDFKDENVDSDDEDDDYGSGDGGNNAEEEDDGKHLRMLQGITGMPSDAFEEKKKKKSAVIYESYPESEYNPTRDVVEGSSRITVEDLVESLKENPSYTKLQSITKKSHKKSLPLQAPLAKELRDRVERKAAYELSKKHITNYEPFVKSYREAPTVIFDKDTDSGYSTVGAIASEFKPRTDFEKKMFSLVYDTKVVGAHKEDGAKLLELNKIPVEDYATYRNHIAKMRSLLFRHEMKSKRIKKIKSKAYHRLLKKDKLKSTDVDIQMSQEEAKELAMKQEFKRAEERLTLRHKKNKFTQRIKERGINVQDEGTRAALAEQFAEHNRLTRKTNSMNDSSSDDSDSEEDDDNMADLDQERALKVLGKATEKTLQLLKEDDSVPNTGLTSLPFMKRALKKRDEAAAEEAKLALQELESSVKHLTDPDGAGNIKAGATSGRRVFGPKKQVIAPKENDTTINHSSDTEEEVEAREDNNAVLGERDDSQNGVTINTAVPNSYSGAQKDSLCKSFDGDGESAPRTTYEVAMLVEDKWKNMNKGNEADTKVNKLAKFAEPTRQNQDLLNENEESETDSEEEMVDGILSSGVDKSYKLPSQADLVREAFAGDDVEDEFIRDKEGILNEENPEPEKPVLLPGWGQWTHVQKKKGLPSWMLEEHEIAKRKRAETLKTRKDANLKHVIISEKLDRKAEKLHTKTLPYPFTSTEVYEQSIRMPIGPEFNPATAIGALNRPEVVKKPGLIIKPIKFEDVDPYEKGGEKEEGHKRTAQKPKERIKKSRNKAKPMIVKS